MFISIQALPALLDLPQEPEVSEVSCGSRHTAAVTRECPGRGGLRVPVLWAPDDGHCPGCRRRRALHLGLG